VRLRVTSPTAARVEALLRRILEERGTPRRALHLALRLLLGALFVYAGLVKLLDVRALAVDVANYRLLPDSCVPAFAAALPGVELACGACLVSGRWLRAAAWLAVLMMAMFSIATGQAVIRGINLDCGCFGAGRAPVTVVTLLRDLGLLGAAVATSLTAAPR
jgi:putative oxidoreductase